MFFRTCLRLCFGVLTLGLPRAASADFVVSVLPSSQTIFAGGSGFLDFRLTTTTAIDLGGFNVTVTAPTSSGITFTSGSASVPNYIFAGNLSGLFQFTNPLGSRSGDISDFPGTLNASLAPGTYGLGRMFFQVASNAPQSSVNITLDAATSFTQGVPPFGAYSYTPSGGSTIASVRVIPEPASVVLASIYVTGAGLFWFRRRWNGPGQ